MNTLLRRLPRPVVALAFLAAALLAWPLTAARADAPSAPEIRVDAPDYAPRQLGDDDPTKIGDAGDWDVSPSGAFTYSVPIDVPPLPGGGSPNLRLVYDSQSRRNGVLGYGWRLAGIPAIVRVNVGRGIAYDGGDTFAFAPGGYGTTPSRTHHLVDVSSSGRFGAGPRTYHMRRDNMHRFSAHPARSGTCAHDHCVWIMEDGRGNKWFFGGDPNGFRVVDHTVFEEHGSYVPGWPDSRVLLGEKGWLLSRFEDAHGNGWSVHYDRTGGAVRPDRITYFDAGSRLQAPHEIELRYTPSRPDPVRAPYLADRLLERIVVKLRRRVLRQVQLGYEQSPVSGRSRLRTVQLLDPQGSSAGMPPLTFDWSDGGDVRGDLVELVEHRPEMMFQGTPAGADFPPQVLVGDVNCDGRDDVVRFFHGAVQSASGQGDARLLATRVQQAHGSADGLGPARTDETLVPWPQGTDDDYDHAPHRERNALLADINGDSCADLVTVGFDGDHVAEITYRFGNPDGLESRESKRVRRLGHAACEQYASRHGLHHCGSFDHAWRALVGDVDGDQRQDIVLVNAKHGDLIYALGRDDGLLLDSTTRARRWERDLSFPECWTVTSDFGPCVTLQNVALADINGDGADDFVAHYLRVAESSSYHEGVLKLAYAFGGGSRPLEVVREVWRLQDHFLWSSALRLGDFDGDGRDDLLNTYSGYSSPNSNQPLGREILLSLGAAVGTPGASAPTYPRVFPGWDVQHLVESRLKCDQDGGDFEHGRQPAGSPGSRGWSALVGDLDADGCDDLVAAYRGPGGTDTDAIFGRPDGTLSNVSHLQDSSSPAAKEWRLHLADVHGDGIKDILWSYHGDAGFYLRYLPGGAGGRGSSVTVFASPDSVDPEEDTISEHGRQVLFPDLNGDGKRDLLVLTPHDRSPSSPNLVGDPHSLAVRYAVSTPSPVDVIEGVRNGWGGTISVVHESAVDHAGAILPERRSCGADSGADTQTEGACGYADNTARYLAERVVTEDGHGPSSTVEISFQNGRYQPGTITERGGLGFEVVTSNDLGTSKATRATYRQDGNFRGHKSVEEILAAGQPVRVARHSYAERDIWAIPGGPTAILHTEVRSEELEGGVLVHSGHREIGYDVFLRRSYVLDEVDGDQRTTITRYWSDAGRWLLDRVRSRRTTHDSGGGLVLDWDRYSYDPAKPVGLVLHERLLFDEADQARCGDMVDECAAAAASGSARWVTVASGHVYDVFGNLEQVSDALGHVSSSTYHPVFPSKVRTKTNALGHVTTYAYDDLGRLESVTDANGQVSRTEHDSWGRKARVFGPFSGVPASGQRWWSYSNPASSALNYSDTNELLDESLRSRRTRHLFDGFGEAYERRTYGSDGCVVREMREVAYEGSPSTRVVRTSNRACWREDLSSGLTALESRLLGLSGDQDKAPVATAVELSPSEAVMWKEVRHDAAGRPAAVTLLDSDGDVVRRLRTIVYGSDGAVRISDARGNTETWYLDGRGRVEFRVDAFGMPTRYTFDGAGRVRSVLLPPGERAREIELRYDSWGRLRSVSDDATGTTRYAYDDAGNIELRTNAARQSLRWIYDDLDRVLFVLDGRCTSFGETGADSLVSFKGSKGGLDEVAARLAEGAVCDPLRAYTYDDEGVPNGLGRLSSVEHATGSLEVLAYDAMGRLTERLDTLDGLPGSYTSSFAFDWSGRLTHVVLPDGSVQENEHDNRDNVRRVLVDGRELASYREHNGNGRPRLRVTADGSSTEIDYDDEGRVHTLLTSAPAGEALTDLVYAYDPEGNVDHIIDHRWGRTSLTGFAPKKGISTSAKGGTKLGALGSISSAPQSCTHGDGGGGFDYDAMNRLVYAESGSRPALSYRYDAQGNLRQKGSLGFRYQRSGSDLWVLGQEGRRYRSIASVDAAGRRRWLWSDLGRKGHWVYEQYAYDLFDRLVEVKENGRRVLEHGYNHAGHRTLKVSTDSRGVTTTTYSLLAGVYEVRASSADPGVLVPSRVIRGPDGVVATLTGSTSRGMPSVSQVTAARCSRLSGSTSAGVPSGTYYHHLDRQGSTVTLTDASGGEVSRLVYRPYGELDRDDSTGFALATRTYTGQLQDDETGLLFYGARYYDPKSAAFLTADSMLYVAGLGALGHNRFAYALGNPFAYNDPTGHEPAPADSPNTSRTPILASDWGMCTPNEPGGPMMSLPTDTPDVPDAPQAPQSGLQTLSDALTPVGLIRTGIEQGVRLLDKNAAELLGKANAPTGFIMDGIGLLLLAVKYGSDRPITTTDIVTDAITGTNSVVGLSSGVAEFVAVFRDIGRVAKFSGPAGKLALAFSLGWTAGSAVDWVFTNWVFDNKSSIGAWAADRYGPEYPPHWMD